MKKIHRAGAILLLFAVLFSLSVPAAASDSVDAVLADTAATVYQSVPSPQFGAIGGEWAVIGLARSGYDIPDRYYTDYYAAIEAHVSACSGKLHEKKYTEYSRLILALTAIGRDARQVAGYDLTVPLGDYEKTIWQGVNGPIWALLALDCGDYPMPQNPQAETQATRQMYIDYILQCQCSDGGWSLSGGALSDADLTGMALQALAKYQDQPAVAAATAQALSCMSRQQDETGGFSSWGTSNSESCVQMLVALCELGLPLDDARFVKNGHTLLDALMNYYQPGQGFVHTLGGTGSDQMATEQGLYALAAVQRAAAGRSSLYRMDDAIQLGSNAASGAGLPGKHPDVQSVPVTAAGVTFTDLAGSPCRAAVEALASRSILTGRDAATFAPDASMTRAEFAAVVVRALGLTPQRRGLFEDVSADSWYAGFVDTAAFYGIVNGKQADRFVPAGTITRQEAAVMVARAGALCGMQTDFDTAAIRDTLAQFTDYVQTAEWARQSLAFCYQAQILDDAALEIRPTQAITRGEVAQMLYQLLEKAELL